AVARALEVNGGFGEERSFNDPADHHWRREFEGDLTDVVWAVEDVRGLVGSNLDYCVNWRVADRLSGAYRIISRFVDDGATAGVLVAEDAGKTGTGDKLVCEFGREGGDDLREVATLEGHGDAGDLPVAGGGVLAPGDLAADAPAAAHRLVCQALGDGAGGEFG